MSRILERVQDEILTGELSYREIAEMFNMDLMDVLDIADDLWLAVEEKEMAEYRRDMNEADPGDQDGDHDSALASVGWGTDEDYGGTWDDIEY